MWHSARTREPVLVDALGRQTNAHVPATHNNMTTIVFFSFMLNGESNFYSTVFLYFHYSEKYNCNDVVSKTLIHYTFRLVCSLFVPSSLEQIDLFLLLMAHKNTINLYGSDDNE